MSGSTTLERLGAFTRDQHRARRLGTYYAGGYGGHGVAMATFLGELIAPGCRASDGASALRRWFPARSARPPGFADCRRNSRDGWLR
jgi:glycine/D-amino acid oxidase-like deaminating enzyme